MALSGVNKCKRSQIGLSMSLPFSHHFETWKDGGTTTNHIDLSVFLSGRQCPALGHHPSITRQISWNKEAICAVLTPCFWGNWAFTLFILQQTTRARVTGAVVTVLGHDRHVWGKWLYRDTTTVSRQGYWTYCLLERNCLSGLDIRSVQVIKCNSYILLRCHFDKDVVV